MEPSDKITSAEIKMIGSHAIQDRMRAGCIIADHTAHRGAFSGRRIGAKHQTKFSGRAIEVRENDARFNDCVFGIGSILMT